MVAMVYDGQSVATGMWPKLSCANEGRNVFPGQLRETRNYDQQHTAIMSSN